MEHQIEENILSVEHRVEIESKKENLDFLKKVDALEQKAQAK